MSCQAEWVGRPGGYDFITSVRASAHTHTTTTLQHTLDAPPAVESPGGCTHFLGHLCLAWLMTHLYPSPAQKQALSLFLASFLLIEQRRQKADTCFPKAVHGDNPDMIPTASWAWSSHKLMLGAGLPLDPGSWFFQWSLV